MKLDFNLTHLRYFRDAAQQGGVAKAAAKNFVTHSAISQGIKRLEESLGIELVAHQKRHFRLTDAGKSLLLESDKIFTSLRNFEHQVELSHQFPVGDLTFGSSHSIVSAFLLEPLAKLKNEYPQIRASFRLGKTTYVKKWLEDGLIDFGITLDDGELFGVKKIPLSSGKFILIKKKGLSIGDSKFLITEPRPETLLFLRQYARRWKTEPTILMHVDSWELIAKMAEHGLGIGLVPDFQFSKRENRNLEVIDMGLNIAYELVAVARKEEQISRNAELFLSYLK